MPTTRQELSFSSDRIEEPSFVSAPELQPIRVYDDLRPYSSEEAKIGKSVAFKGAISGAGPLFIDGQVDGSIDIPDERVVIGENGVVVAPSSKERPFGITAREIVILGRVTGGLSASYRIEIYAGGSVTGRLQTPRLRVADGAFLNASVNLGEQRRPALTVVEPISTRPRPQRTAPDRHQDAWGTAAS